MAREAQECSRLFALELGEFSIMEVETIAAAKSLPRHCRLVGAMPEAVRFELRLPTAWNEKLLVVGNGGYLGMFFDQSYGLARGYATASTDTGHEGPDPRFAFNNRSAEIDFAYRAMHLTVEAAKRIIEEYYGRRAKYAYFRGCSTGGRQGLMEAQRYPEDFDGWSIGAPLYDYSQKQVYNATWVMQALFSNDREGYVPRAKLKALGQAVYERCDGVDGLRDGLIDDPRRCDFDAGLHLPHCRDGADGRNCFTAAQVAAISKIYAGPGADIYPGHVVGGEWIDVPRGRMGGGWDVYFTGMLRSSVSASNTVGQMDRDPYGGDEFEPVQLRNAMSFFKYFAFEDDRPDYNALKDLSFDNVPDVSFAAKLFDASSPDLSLARNAGKKIVMWHGWADVGLNPIRTIQYYEAVKELLGTDDTHDFLRLFMVPGMYHCEGGPGPDIFDDLTALEAWVEREQAPETMVAYKTKGANDFYPRRAPRGARDSSILRSRPLCTYPRVARYRGTGSIDEASNFFCVTP